MPCGCCERQGELDAESLGVTLGHADPAQEVCWPRPLDGFALMCTLIHTHTDAGNRKALDLPHAEVAIHRVTLPDSPLGTSTCLPLGFSLFAFSSVNEAWLA